MSISRIILLFRWRPTRYSDEPQPQMSIIKIRYSLAKAENEYETLEPIMIKENYSRKTPIFPFALI